MVALFQGTLKIVASIHKWDDTFPPKKYTCNQFFGNLQEDILFSKNYVTPFDNFLPKKKLHARGSIVFTTFILHSLCPIVFLEIVWVFQHDGPMKCCHYKKKTILCAIHHLPKSSTQNTDLSMKMQPQISMFKPNRCCEQQLTQKLEITLKDSELEPITQQLTNTWSFRTRINNTTTHTKLGIALEASELESITLKERKLEVVLILEE